MNDTNTIQRFDGTVASADPLEEAILRFVESSPMYLSLYEAYHPTIRRLIGAERLRIVKVYNAIGGAFSPETRGLERFTVVVGKS